MYFRYRSCLLRNEDIIYLGDKDIYTSMLGVPSKFRYGSFNLWSKIYDVPFDIVPVKRL